MAITIIQSPDAITPAYNPVLFLISSTNTAQPNFRFIAEVKNSGGTVLAKLKIPIIPGTIKGWVDIHRILESYVTHDFDIGLITAAEQTNSWMEYSVSFGEEYGSTITEHLGLTASGALRIWNASLKQIEEMADYAPATFVTAASGSDGKWLSAFGTSKRVRIDQKDFLSYIAISTTGPTSIQVAALRSGGSTVTSRFSPGTLGGGRRVYRVPSGPVNLNQIASLITGTPGAVIPSDTVSYTVKLYDGAATYGPTMTYTIQANETIHASVDFFFLNRFGAFESFRFDNRSENAQSIERATYDKPLTQYDGTNVGWDTTSGSKVQYNTALVRTFKAFSNWVTPEENEAILDLLSSPVVYSYIAGALRQITITTNNWLEHKRVNDKQRFIELTAQYNTGDRRQSR